MRHQRSLAAGWQRWRRGLFRHNAQRQHHKKLDSFILGRSSCANSIKIGPRSHFHCSQVVYHMMVYQNGGSVFRDSWMGYVYVCHLRDSLSMNSSTLSSNPCANDVYGFHLRMEIGPQFLVLHTLMPD